MSSEIITALLALIGTAIGSIGGVMASARLTSFRLKQLEDKVKLHNNAIERLYKVEERAKSNTHRIDEMEEIKGGR